MSASAKYGWIENSREKIAAREGNWNEISLSPMTEKKSVTF